MLKSQGESIYVLYEFPLSARFFFVRHGVILEYYLFLKIIVLCNYWKIPKSILFIGM